MGKVCDLEGDSRLLRDLAVQPALSRAPCPHRGLVFGEAALGWPAFWAPALTALQLNHCFQRQFGGFFSSLKVQCFRFAALQITVC